MTFSDFANGKTNLVVASYCEKGFYFTTYELCYPLSDEIGTVERDEAGEFFRLGKEASDFYRVSNAIVYSNAEEYALLDRYEDTANPSDSDVKAVEALALNATTRNRLNAV